MRKIITFLGIESVIVINFAHPLTEQQRGQIEEESGMAVTAVYDIPCHFDDHQPLLPQVKALLPLIPLSSQEWQMESLVINPPGLAAAASALTAELHGRMGHFPAIIRIRPVNGSASPRFEVAEIINLQAVRDAARCQR